MARFLQWSDLHREFGRENSPVEFPRPTTEHPAGSVDAILIAGDLNAEGRTVRDMVEIHKAWGVPVVLTPGNHDFYYTSLESEVSLMRDRAAAARAEGHDVHVLDRDELVIAGTRILATTLWTDFEIVGDRDTQMFGAKYVINDYRKILGTDTGLSLLPDHTVEEHAQSRAWLLDALSTEFDGPTVVMTHHIPVPEALAAKARKGNFAPAYVSDMREDILDKRIDLWISGHSHEARRGLIEGLHGPIAFTANMQGYPDQHTNFEPYRILDSEHPTRGLEPIGIEVPELSGLPAASEVLARLRDRQPIAYPEP